MKNMKITVKLGISFAMMTFITVIIAALGIYGLLSLSSVATDMYANKAKPLGELTTATEYFQRLRVQVRNAIIYSGDTEQLKTVESDMNDRMSQFENSMATYEPTLATDEGRKLFSEIMDRYSNTFKPGILRTLNSAKDNADINILLEEMAETTQAANIIANDISQLVQVRLDVMSKSNDNNIKTSSTLLITTIVFVIISLLFSTVISLYIPLSISKPVIFMKGILLKIGTQGDLAFSDEEFKTIEKYAAYRDEVGESISMLNATVHRLVVVGSKLEAVSNGDLTTEIEKLSDKDTMGISLHKMIDNLNEMFSEINASTVQVSSGSKQISDGAQSLAHGSSEQAAAVEELTSSMSGMAEKIRDSADTATRAATLANTIKQNAEVGNRQMDEMMNAVKEINHASQGISKVIKVIDDIAFQTNILALNAAVEAARAGQHGKGFAVVAEEVRSLAAKSAEAARDTGGLIANSIEKAELGARIADATAASLSEIVEGINESSQLVSKIAKSSGEQSEDIEEINRGIDQVAKVIQQNNAAAEESAAASEEMSGQATMLEGLVAQFKLKNGSSGMQKLTRGAKSTSKKLIMPEKTINQYDSDVGGFGKY